MLNEQELGREKRNSKYNISKPVEPTSLPKLSYDYSPEKVSNKHLLSQFDSLKRSYSMSRVIHGDGNKRNSHYIDQLDRFKRNHDAKNKQERQIERQTMINRLMQKRNLIIKRQEENRRREEQNFRQIVEKNAKILQGHQKGALRNGTFNTSIPVNPITLKYENNPFGDWQKQKDNEQKVRKLIRGNRIQQMGTSGYNLINGSPTNNTSRILEYHPDIKGLYEHKLQKFNENFRIKPQSNEEFQRFSASKIFKYY